MEMYQRERHAFSDLKHHSREEEEISYQRQFLETKRRRNLALHMSPDSKKHKEKNKEDQSKERPTKNCNADFSLLLFAVPSFFMHVLLLPPQ